VLDLARGGALRKALGPAKKGSFATGVRRRLGVSVSGASPPASASERDSVSSAGRPTHDDPTERKAYRVRMTPTVFVVLVLTIVILAFFAFFTLSLSLSGDPTPDSSYDTITLEIRTAP
jgi:hypothetical protein